MEGHMLAPMLEEEAPEFPFVALLVSGGHTLLASVEGIGEYKILGQTLDDAVGEAFDKTAKILGLGYPGGPAIAKVAESGDLSRFEFPRPMLKRPGMDFSYSGLKTNALRTVQGQNKDQEMRFQEAAVEILSIKSKRALVETGSRRLVVAGGVGANKRLREMLDEMTSELGAKVYFPRIEFCTDNGAMIAYAGAQRLHQAPDSLAFQVKPRWSLEDLPPI
ncbi:UNVERIFIED_CONTAM: hypothetical protein GTU68_001495 [Idotea baltica]|nr:hypothetical protein [Idotea baltica]